MARASWSGAFEINAFPVHLCLFNQAKAKKRGDSFRMLAPNGGPVEQQLVDSDGNVVDRAETGRGIEVSKDNIVPLNADALEAIGKAERSVSVEAEQYCPVDSLPMDLATASFVVKADDKVPLAQKSADVLFSGLRGNKLAYVTRLTMRSGSRDGIVVLYADEKGLLAKALPYVDEVNVIDRGEFTEDAKAAKVFKQFLAASNVKVKPFDHEALVSDYRERRDQVLAKVLDGKVPEAPAAPEVKADTPDLMAALETSIAAMEPKAPAKKAPAKRKKVAA